MSQYNSLEEYAEHVRRETSGILARVFQKFGTDHEVALTIGALCSEAANIVNQSQMRQERAGTYDLGALRVDASSASNSETGWEREE